MAHLWLFMTDEPTHRVTSAQQVFDHASLGKLAFVREASDSLVKGMEDCIVLTSKFFTLSNAHPLFREVNEIPLIPKLVTCHTRWQRILISKHKASSTDLTITASNNGEIQRL